MSWVEWFKPIINLGGEESEQCDTFVENIPLLKSSDNLINYIVLKVGNTFFSFLLLWKLRFKRTIGYLKEEEKHPLLNKLVYFWEWIKLSKTNDIMLFLQYFCMLFFLNFNLTL